MSCFNKNVRCLWSGSKKTGMQTDIMSRSCGVRTTAAPRRSPSWEWILSPHPRLSAHRVLSLCAAGYLLVIIYVAFLGASQVFHLIQAYWWVTLQDGNMFPNKDRVPASFLWSQKHIKAKWRKMKNMQKKDWKKLNLFLKDKVFLPLTITSYSRVERQHSLISLMTCRSKEWNRAWLQADLNSPKSSICTFERWHSIGSVWPTGHPCGENPKIVGTKDLMLLKHSVREWNKWRDLGLIADVNKRVNMSFAAYTTGQVVLTRFALHKYSINISKAAHSVMHTDCEAFFLVTTCLFRTQTVPGILVHCSLSPDSRISFCCSTRIHKVLQPDLFPPRADCLKHFCFSWYLCHAEHSEIAQLIQHLRARHSCNHRKNFLERTQP